MHQALLKNPKVRLAFFMLVPVAMMACTENSVLPFEKYKQRLANVLDTPVPEAGEHTHFSLPSTRQLYREPSSVTIGLLDSYELRNCGLLELISERNSILGKVSDPFRLYDYQVKFITTAIKCLKQESLNENIKVTLSEALVLKQQELNSVYLSNLIWTSEAMKAQWAGYVWLSDSDLHHSSQVQESLATIESAFIFAERGEWDKIPSLTRHQETLEKQGGLGRLVYSLESATFELAELNEFIQANFPNVTCGPKRDNTQFEYLNNVMHQQYIEAIQPKLAKLNQLYYEFQKPAGVFKSDALSYQLSLEQYHVAFHREILAHVDHWKQLSERCR
ncbi:DUF3080 family protein [Vibrio mexicanus]|uniref:DUF3080 family protein n=1 Tax=Vibrio mexicanus TaxID=1004326 RepID=UPI00069C301A|nr:DUF3080 family protein [Vibrio mexicanus]